MLRSVWAWQLGGVAWIRGSEGLGDVQPACFWRALTRAHNGVNTWPPPARRASLLRRFGAGHTAPSEFAVCRSVFRHTELQPRTKPHVHHIHRVQSYSGDLNQNKPRQGKPDRLQSQRARSFEISKRGYVNLLEFSPPGRRMPSAMIRA